MKTCSKCGQEKELGEFGKNKNAKDGLLGKCKECRKLYDSEWRKANKDKANCATRKWRKKNPVSRRKSYSKWYDKGGRFSVALTNSRSDAEKNDYEPCDATIEELEAAFTGRCFICGVSELDCFRRLSMDHDHTRKTDNFRGWLCNKCNKALGGFRDSEELLIDALHYLMRDRVETT